MYFIFHIIKYHTISFYMRYQLYRIRPCYIIYKKTKTGVVQQSTTLYKSQIFFLCKPASWSPALLSFYNHVVFLMDHFKCWISFCSYLWFARESPNISLVPKLEVRNTYYKLYGYDLCKGSFPSPKIAIFIRFSKPSILGTFFEILGDSETFFSFGQLWELNPLIEIHPNSYELAPEFIRNFAS